MEQVMNDNFNLNDIKAIVDILEIEALKIAYEDIEINKAIGRNGEKLLKMVIMS